MLVSIILTAPGMHFIISQLLSHPAGFDHAERAGEEQGTGCHHDDDGGHVLAYKIAYFFQSFHVVSSFLFYRLFLHETSGMARCRNKKRLCLPS